MRYHHQETSSPPHVLARPGRHHGAAVARFDGSRADAACQNRRQSANPARAVLHPARRGDAPTGLPDAEGPFEAFAHAQPARAVQGSGGGGSATWPIRWPRPAGPGDNGGDHTRSPAVFLNGVHPKRTDGADIRAGTDHRPDRRGRNRPGDAAAVARTGHRRLTAGWSAPATWASAAPT